MPFLDDNQGLLQGVDKGEQEIVWRIGVGEELHALHPLDEKGFRSHHELPVVRPASYKNNFSGTCDRAGKPPYLYIVITSLYRPLVYSRYLPNTPA